MYKTIAQAQDCDLCKTIKNSVLDFLDHSHTRNFGGGNSDFEESKMGSYRTSETRLMELIENLYEKHGYSPSNLMIQELESRIEEWWTKIFVANPKLDKPALNMSLNICVPRFCCPVNKFGPQCLSCEPCNLNGGFCNGNATKQGTGKCECYAGFNGDDCSQCDLKLAYPTHNSCSLCNKACDGCSGPTDADCNECSSGFEMIADACKDVDECSTISHNCTSTTFCNNTIGSFICVPCNHRCKTCFGPNYDQCNSCINGYRLNDTTCADIDECTDLSACKSVNEQCVNNIGSFSCHCKPGFERSEDNCIPVQVGIEGDSDPLNKDEL